MKYKLIVLIVMVICCIGCKDFKIMADDNYIKWTIEQHYKDGFCDTASYTTRDNYEFRIINYEGQTMMALTNKYGAWGLGQPQGNAGIIRIKVLSKMNITQQ